MTSYGAIPPSDQGDDFPVARSVDTFLINTQQRRTTSLRLPDQPRRRPYLFENSRNASQLSLNSSTQDSTSLADYHREQNMAIRYRLFNRLDPGGTHLIMPDHVIPPMLFSVWPFDDFKDEDGKQGSIVTIFSIWNTMMGTSLLAMPWALQQAGLGLGLVLMLLMALIALYTAYRVVQSPQGLTLDVDSANAEFSDVCRYFWGKPGEYIAVFFSITVLIGGVIVYWVLMSNFLFYTGNIVYEALQPNSTTIPIMANKTFTCDIYCPDTVGMEQFSYLGDELYDSPAEVLMEENSALSRGFNYETFWNLRTSVPIYLALLTFPLMNFKSPTFFTKFNVLGTVSVAYLLIFTFSKALECGFHMNFTDIASPNYAALYNLKFPALTGTLALSYFIHNAVLTILRNQKNPENNVRDLSIGYLLAAICYTFIGFMFYAGFPTFRRCIADNFLNNFGTGDVMSATARVFLLFQMITVLPLLMYLIRAQLSYMITGNVYPGLGNVCVLNVSVISIAVFFAIVYPHVGSILRYVGSLSGMWNVSKFCNVRNNGSTILTFLRLCSEHPVSSNYVARARHMDYWQQSDSALEMEFDRGKFMLMVDKEPLVYNAAKLQFNAQETNTEDQFKIEYSPELATFDYHELRTKLREYGLEIGQLNSALLDVLDPTETYHDYRPLFGCAVRTMEPPAESGISIRDLRQQLGKSLGGEFMNLRMAMLTIGNEQQRNLLARFQALTRWYLIYRRCPTCATPLRTHISKMSATCMRCNRVYYPTISPVAICLITDESNENCLLVRHRGSVGSVFTCVAGFAMVGESLQETVRREIAEEIGILARDIRALNMSQPWPMPNNSLMTAFTAVANMEERIEVAPEELERAEWFTRDQVKEALERVIADPNLRGVKFDKSDVETRQLLRYIPPKGAVAHHIIKQWVMQE